MLENKSMLNNLLDDSALEDVVGGQGRGVGQKMHACPGGTFGKIVETEKFSSGGYRIFKCTACGAEGKVFPMPGQKLFRIISF